MNILNASHNKDSFSSFFFFFFFLFLMVFVVVVAVVVVVVVREENWAMSFLKGLKEENS